MSANPYENMSAFADVPPISARTAFWTNSKSWPNDTEDYEFIGRSVLAVGRDIYGARWNDNDPAATFELPLPVQLSRYELDKNVDRAVAILKKSHPVFAARSAVRNCYPTDEEWTVAYRIDLERSRTDTEALTRFVLAQGRLIEAFRLGNVVSAERSYWGGEIRPLPRHFWNGEGVHWRFDTCRFDPNQQFGPPGPYTGQGHWLFVEKKSLYAAPNPPVGEAEKKQAETVVAEAVEKKRSRAGRKPMPVWDVLQSELVRLIYVEGRNIENNLSALARELWEFGNEAQLGDLPEPKTIEGKLRIWLAKVR